MEAAMNSHPWHSAYTAAVLETDQSQMGDRIAQAESAIRERFQSSELDAKELNAMKNALEGLRTLRAERAGPQVEFHTGGRAVSMPIDPKN
jgi:hypothetical protein